MATVRELEKAFSEALDEAMVQRRGDGFDYIPWKAAVKEMNRICGVLGWSYQVVAVAAHDDGYSAAANVTVYPSDGPAITKGAAGHGATEVTSAGKPMSKMAQTKAERNALTRALALFGPRMGFDLYPDREDSESGGTFRRAGGGASGMFNPDAKPKPSGVKAENKGAEPTPGQLEWLRKLGYKGDLDALTRGEASDILDKLFEAKNAEKSKGKARRASAERGSDGGDGDMPIR